MRQHRLVEGEIKGTQVVPIEIQAVCTNRPPSPLCVY